MLLTHAIWYIVYLVAYFILIRFAVDALYLKALFVPLATLNLCCERSIVGCETSKRQGIAFYQCEC